MEGGEMRWNVDYESVYLCAGKRGRRACGG